MTRAGSPKLAGYAALGAVGLVAAMALRRPELVILAAPFLVLLVVGTRIARDPEVTAELALETERTIEGADVSAVLTLRSTAPVDRLEVLVDLPARVEVVGGSAARAVRMPSATEHAVSLVLCCRRWGAFDLDEVDVRALDPFRLVVWAATLHPRRRLEAYPSDVTLRRLVAPRDTQAFAGSEVARVKGDGVEYADLRDFVPGDRVRSINWRASARRQALVVNERHPERNADVVLLLDSFGDVHGDGTSVLEQAVRAAATLARRYLERRDRVGVVGLGGTLRWLQPGMGAAHGYRLVETLLETGVQPTYTWADVGLVPARVLPPKALVLGLTPLLDPRFVSALHDLRARRFDVAVVEIDPVPFVPAGRSRAERLAHRLWILDREIQRAQLREAGIAVAAWQEPGLDAALEEVRTFRRYARTARG